MWELENLSWTVEERRRYWDRQYGIVLRYGNAICRRLNEATTLEQINNLYVRSDRCFSNDLTRIKSICQPTVVPGSDTRH